VFAEPDGGRSTSERARRWPIRLRTCQTVADPPPNVPDGGRSADSSPACRVGGSTTVTATALTMAATDQVPAGRRRVAATQRARECDRAAGDALVPLRPGSHPAAAYRPPRSNAYSPLRSHQADRPTKLRDNYEPPGGWIDHRVRRSPDGGRSADATRRRSVGRAATVWHVRRRIDHRRRSLGADRPPSTVEPSTAEPATAEPATTEPATTEPATTEPATTEPATIRPATRQTATKRRRRAPRSRKR
jgi:hypothetical protein